LLPLLADNKAFETAKTQVGELAETIDKSSADLGKFADAWAGLDVKKMQLFAGFASEFSGSLGTAADNLNKLDFTKSGQGIADFLKGAGALGGIVLKDDPILKSIGNGFKAVAAYGELMKVQEQTAITDKANAQLEAELQERVSDPAKFAEHQRQLAEKKAQQEAPQKARDAEREEKKQEEQSKREGDLAAAAAAESLKASNLEKQNAAKREALDLELSIKEAQAAGNESLLARLQWQKEYTSLLKAGLDAKDPDAYNKAIRGANADANIKAIRGANASMEDPLAKAREIEKQARSSVQLSSLGRLGMAMGESSNASATISKLQELIVAQQTSSAALGKIASNTAEMAKQRGGYQ
jgi:hypothetical protein